MYKFIINPSSCGRNSLPLPTMNLWVKRAFEKIGNSNVGSGVGFVEGAPVGIKLDDGAPDGETVTVGIDVGLLEFKFEDGTGENVWFSAFAN